MIEEIKILIGKLEIDPARKQALLDKLEQGGATPELAAEVQKILQENETALRAESPEMMDEIELAHKQADDKMEQAHQEFDIEMDQIEKQADSDYAQAAKDVDAAELEDTRAALS
jgi:hypothetical protein